MARRPRSIRLPHPSGSKADLIESVRRYRGIVNNSEGYQKEHLLNLMSETKSWVIMYDTDTSNWFAAPIDFCTYREAYTNIYQTEYTWFDKKLSQDQIKGWTDEVESSQLIFRECELALQKMASYFGSTLRDGICLFIVKGYEPVRVFDYVFDSLSNKLDGRVAQSALLPRKLRLARLEAASAKPSKVTVQTSIFLRNPDVIAEVLYLAAGKCGSCNRMAPFKKHSDQTPYLEVHHKRPLSEGGDDTVENAIALCPNCHRYAHHGVARSHQE